ncbi:hypothetical protein [Solicola gregarius]|uniref:Uncharacterized protein n=1 Tax=Solicola gregarius TaxID=2908642 RepID=A0AA46TJD7_9ACTN|nr:hypothetical protein [Solicola gregarius]UYM06370.1 hypothetical protein L0C25_04645 [Solicola gregarius]
MRLVPPRMPDLRDVFDIGVANGAEFNHDRSSWFDGSRRQQGRGADTNPIVEVGLQLRAQSSRTIVYGRIYVIGTT